MAQLGLYHKQPLRHDEAIEPPLLPCTSPDSVGSGGLVSFWVAISPNAQGPIEAGEGGVKGLYESATFH